MNSRKMETNALIREVKRREILWNTSHEHYYHKTKKKSAWQEVCRQLYENFAQQDDVQQKILIQDVMGRWRTIRDNFVRKRKENSQALLSGSGVGTKRIKKYIFHDQLSFLNKQIDRRLSSCSSHSNLEHILQNESCSERVEETPSLPSSFLHLSPKREQESPTIDEKIPIEAKVEENMPELDPFDEDLGFFISLLPTVKSLSRLEKLDFRIKTMQLLQNQLSQQQLPAVKQQGNSNGEFHGTEFSTCGSETNDQMYLLENE